MTQPTATRRKPPDDSGAGSFGINLDDVLDDDIRVGLPVIIYARWVLVIAGLGLSLWNSANFVEAQVSVLIILVLAVGNFFLQVEVNRERPITKWIVYGASAVDIGAITGVLKLTDMTCPHNLYHSLC